MQTTQQDWREPVIEPHGVDALGNPLTIIERRYLAHPPSAVVPLVGETAIFFEQGVTCLEGRRTYSFCDILEVDPVFTDRIRTVRGWSRNYLGVLIEQPEELEMAS